jgi:hypothetical protein
MDSELQRIATADSQDSLAHDQIASALIRHLKILPRGSVIAVQGSWGRGKTDILTRLDLLLTAGSKEGSAVRPVWINPWQYGVPDLLTPLVLELIERVNPEERADVTYLSRCGQNTFASGERDSYTRS